MDEPLRFRCPPEFEAVAPGVALGGPHTELWLIRAPADFCPQSLEGCPVPLNGLERLRTPPGGDNDKDTGDTAELLVLRAGPGGGDCPLLLSPVPSRGSLRCAPQLRGSLTITRSFGTPPGNPPARKKRKKAKVTVAPEGTSVPPQEGAEPPQEGTEPPQEGAEPPQEGTEPGEGPGPPQDVPEVAKRKKKKKKHKREEQE